MATKKPTLKGTNRIIEVKVTQPIIELAQKADSSHCMIADAIRVAIPEAKSVSVDLATIRFTDPAKRVRYIYLTPPTAQAALVDFDQGVDAKPFAFRLTKAVQVVESGQRTMPDGTRKKNPSQAVQGVSGASNRGHPVKLGGKVPPVAALSSKPTRRKSVAAANVEKTTAKVPPKTAAAEKRAAATKKAEQQVAARERGVPVTETGSNITLAVTPSRVRKFGMKQLRA